MRVGQLSNKGNIRLNNEDNVYSSRDKSLFIIADGMGGHNAGEVASKYAINKVRNYIKREFENTNKSKDDILNLISNAINYANRAIYNLSKKENSLQGMGTTIIVAIINDNNIYIGHVGDSRAYLFDKKKIKQITTDHSLAQELYKNGTITKEEFTNYPHKNIITRALGIKQNINIDTYHIEFEKEKILLLCTDGLNNMLSDEEIHKIILKSNSPHQCAKFLVESANKAGGTDNTSVIVIMNEI